MIDTFPNILISVLMISILLIFKPQFWIMMLIINGVTIARIIYKKQKTGIINTLISLNLFLVFIYGLNWAFKDHAVIGFVITIIAVAAYILIKNKRSYMDIMRRVEKEIFGKPLDQIKREKDGKQNKR